MNVQVTAVYSQPNTPTTSEVTETGRYHVSSLLPSVVDDCLEPSPPDSCLVVFKENKNEKYTYNEPRPRPNCTIGQIVT